MVYLQSYIFIYHPPSCPSPQWLRGSSGARQGKLLSARASLSACTSINLSMSVHYPANSALLINPAVVSSADEAPHVRDDAFYLTSKTLDKAERSILVSELNEIQPLLLMSSPLCEHRSAFCSSVSMCFASQCI